MIDKAMLGFHMDMQGGETPDQTEGFNRRQSWCKEATLYLIWGEVVQ